MTEQQYQQYTFGARLFGPKIQVPVLRSLPRSIPSSYTMPVPSSFRPYDQGRIGSCVANSICHAFNLVKTVSFDPSRLFLYYNARARSGLIGQDGAYLDDGMESIRIQGVCVESMWAYDVRRVDVRPPTKAYTNASLQRSNSWSRVPLGSGFVSGIKQVIARNIPVVIGVGVYSSFMTQNVRDTGIIPLPNRSTESMLGGHAITLIGYNDTIQAFIGVNSWGTSWGGTIPGSSTRGYLSIPYSYIGNSALCDEAVFMNSITITVPVPAPVYRRPVRKPAPPRPHSRRRR